ncbi:Ig-like domain-containing protein [Segetibacter koreensis]|uniref:Ig-like domain-containing protein n=1 Tax=Segetibacter koreensis TaxID=398037 RepID=UPI0003824F70|nr:Ig-like domain-containing protein [Segetibacter koreensis]
MKKFILIIAPFFIILKVSYSQAGRLAASFGDSGIVRTSFGGTPTGYSQVVIQGDEKIEVIGKTGENLALAKYNTDGTLDTTFSGDGKTIGSISGNVSLNPIARQNDGKIIVYGRQDSNFLDRYNTDGSRDSTFSKSSLTFFSAGVSCGAVQSNGKIVVAGSAVTDEGEVFALARYNTDGTIDSTFSQVGKQTTPILPNSRADDVNATSAAIAIQSDGKIVVAGSVSWEEFYNVVIYDAASFAAFVLVRYNADGTLDSTFSNDGIEVTKSGMFEYGYPRSVAIQNDGKIVAVGYVYHATEEDYNNDFVFARYNTDGTVINFSDYRFSSQQLGSNDVANSVAFQDDGKIVIAGNSDGNFALLRLDTNGSLDSTFGEYGKKVTKASTGYNSINAIAISGKSLYGVGFGGVVDSGGNSTSVGIVARYLLDNENKNKPPTVSLSIPYNITKYAAPARIKLNATATDEDGKIIKVRFYNDSTLLHTETVSPYGFLWDNVPLGNYTLTAKAYDNSGNVTTSNNIKVSVVDTNVAPVVSIVSPVNDTTYTGPATIGLVAQAHDANDRIRKVEFYNGTSLLRTEYIYPYAYNWVNVQPGTYKIVAKAYDAKGLSAVSDPISITVTNATISNGRKPSGVQIVGMKTLRLQPNPARDILIISLTGMRNKKSTISIISNSGAVIKTMQTSTNNVIQIDISSLAEGVYFIKVQNGDMNLYQQFVKLK